MSKEAKNKIVSKEVKRKQLRESLKQRTKVEKVKINNGKKIARSNRRLIKPKITLVRICKNIQECDIDDVANKIFKIGKKKEFPDLTIK